MKICLLTNRLTYHQLPLCLALNALSEFKIIVTKEIEKESIHKYPDYSQYSNFIISTFGKESESNLAIELCDTADILIFGSTPFNMVKNRLNKNKITFSYSERVYKKVSSWYEIPLRTIKYYFRFGRHKHLYLLCASAYTSADYAKTGTFKNKAYKWGYFPATNRYDNIDHILSNKSPNSLLWVARFIDWKHPEVPVEIAKRLKRDGYTFTLNMIGIGEEFDSIQAMIESEDLNNCVHLLGSMSPEEVRNHMEQSEIFLFTSDRNEGWGAVLNESMNSACAVVASHAIGSVPFLIDDGKNGYIYEDGNIDDLYRKVRYLLDNPTSRAKIGKAAYKTITEQWNAENAAERFLELAQSILNGEKSPEVFDNGVCSKAKIVKDNWYSK